MGGALPRVNAGRSDGVVCAKDREGPVRMPGGAGRRTAPPCLYRNNCPNETHLQGETEGKPDVVSLHRVTNSHRKGVLSLQENVGDLVRYFGVQNLAFFTVTLANRNGCAPDPDRAQAAWRKMEKQVALEFPGGGVRVMERGGETRRLHFHVLLVAGCDVREGYDFEGSRAAQRADRRAKWSLHPTANANLRRVHDRLFAIARRAGFGVIFHCEPVHSGADAIRIYLSKYICKHVGQRLPEDKGRRLVDYFGDVRERRKFPGASAFAFGGGLTEVKEGKRRPNYRNAWAWIWRAKLAKYAAGFGVSNGDFNTLEQKLGSRWAHFHGEEIRRVRLKSYPHAFMAVMDGELDMNDLAMSNDVPDGEPVPMRVLLEPCALNFRRGAPKADAFSRTMQLSVDLGAAVGEHPGDIYRSLFQPQLLREPGHDWQYVRRIPLARPIFTFLNTPDGGIRPVILK